MRLVGRVGMMIIGRTMMLELRVDIVEKKNNGYV